jgi:hypothetical protein
MCRCSTSGVFGFRRMNHAGARAPAMRHRSTAPRGFEIGIEPAVPCRITVDLFTLHVIHWRFPIPQLLQSVINGYGRRWIAKHDERHELLLFGYPMFVTRV